MAGAFKKTMIYLGLADGDEYEDERARAEERPAARAEAPAPRQGSAASRAPEPSASSLRTGPVAAVPASSTSRGSEVVSIDAAAHGAGAASSARNVEARGAAEQGDSSAYNSSSLAVDPEYRAPVTPIKRAPSSRDESSAMRRITTVHPRSYNDAKVIGESFRDSIPVIMNVTDMGEAEAKRLVDFSAGLVFGLGGSIERVTNKVFLLTPKNVEVLAEERAAGDSPSSAQFFNQS
ncbi:MULTISPECIES: cell division protein SepF [unclassified Nesterenkonia]|uniref:cell division protein SepF n=1 Tax=unclassified Nesterenkonia TaxID=2629769 RepID=UPI000872A681|nr:MULTISPECIES: cell division protein SepF [unclassified Nesterenkonia]MDS2171501.1 cell division protein SepF [Nesterenkonia sp. CL21]